MYEWLEEYQPYSRLPKKSIPQEFSDGVLCAEFLNKILAPGSVLLNFYHPASATGTKTQNWEMLNKKVFGPKLGFQLSADIIDGLVKSKDGYLAYVLYKIRQVTAEPEAATEEFPDEEPSSPPTATFTELGIPDQIDNAESIDTTSLGTLNSSARGNELMALSPTSIASNEEETESDSQAEPEPNTYEDANAKYKSLVHENNYTVDLLKLKKERVAELEKGYQILRAYMEQLSELEIQLFGYC